MVFHDLDFDKSKVPPRVWVQLAGSVVGHPRGLTTNVACPAVEGSTRTVCSGFPTRKANEDHEPSLPSLN